MPKGAFVGARWRAPRPLHSLRPARDETTLEADVESCLDAGGIEMVTLGLEVQKRAGVGALLQAAEPLVSAATDLLKVAVTLEQIVDRMGLLPRRCQLGEVDPLRPAHEAPRCCRA